MTQLLSIVKENTSKQGLKARSINKDEEEQWNHNENKKGKMTILRKLMEHYCKHVRFFINT